MKDKNIIKTITIDIAGTDVKVTPQQAKDLHEALSQLLGLNAPKEVVREVHYNRPYYWPHRWQTWSLGAQSGTIGGTSDNWNVSYQASTANALLQVT